MYSKTNIRNPDVQKPAYFVGPLASPSLDTLGPTVEGYGSEIVRFLDHALEIFGVRSVIYVR